MAHEKHVRSLRQGGGVREEIENGLLEVCDQKVCCPGCGADWACMCGDDFDPRDFECPPADDSFYRQEEKAEWEASYWREWEARYWREWEARYWRELEGEMAEEYQDPRDLEYDCKGPIPYC